MVTAMNMLTFPQQDFMSTFNFFHYLEHLLCEGVQGAHVFLFGHLEHLGMK